MELSRLANKDATHMGALRLLNAINGLGKTLVGEKKKIHELMYIDNVLNVKPTRAMVDMGATQNFIYEEVA